MSIQLAFVLLSLETLAAALYGVHRYGTPLNPLTFDAIFETALTTLFAGLVSYTLLPLAPYTAADMVKTTAVSGLYLAAFTVPYFAHGARPARIFGAAMRLLKLDSERYAAIFNPIRFLTLIGAAAASFAGLIAFSGGGLIWITDTRTAYIHYRAGAGFFWLLTCWFLMTAFIYYLWGHRPNGISLLVTVLVFTIATYFTGSKQAILCVFITALAYYHFLVRRVPTWAMMGAGIAIVAGFFAMLFFQSAMTPANFLSYFQNFDITTQFLSRFNEYGYRFGSGTLSELWFYVPRALYPAKPLEYGALLIPAHLFPGAYEAGYAPGFLGWSLSYLDFGWVGVLAAGLLKGITQRAVFEYYLSHRRSFFGFIFMMQYCLWAVLAFATLPISVVWCVAMSVLLRLVLVSRSTVSAGSNRTVPFLPS